MKRYICNRCKSDIPGYQADLGFGSSGKRYDVLINESDEVGTMKVSVIVKAPEGPLRSPAEFDLCGACILALTEKLIRQLKADL